MCGLRSRRVTVFAPNRSPQSNSELCQRRIQECMRVQQFSRPIHERKLKSWHNPSEAWFQDHGNKICSHPALSVFLAKRNRMPGMRAPLTPYRSPKTLLWGLPLLASALLAMSWTLLADTPGRLKSTQAAGCYCHCSRSKGLGSCVKMCELPKYASRWWATSCAKSRSRYSGDNPGAGPRLRHKDRAEHARL
jgi:hypothetical protein